MGDGVGGLEGALWSNLVKMRAALIYGDLGGDCRSG